MLKYASEAYGQRRYDILSQVMAGGGQAACDEGCVRLPPHTRPAAGEFTEDIKQAVKQGRTGYCEGQIIRGELPDLVKTVYSVKQQSIRAERSAHYKEDRLTDIDRFTAKARESINLAVQAAEELGPTATWEPREHLLIGRYWRKGGGCGRQGASRMVLREGDQPCEGQLISPDRRSVWRRSGYTPAPEVLENS